MKAIVTALLVSALAIFAAAHASETVKGAKKDLEAFKAEMSAKIDKADKEIAALKESAKKKTDATKEKTISDLEATRDKLRDDLKELKEESGTKWQKLKKGIADNVDLWNNRIQEALRK